MIGGHVVKRGLAPVIIDLMRAAPSPTWQARRSFHPRFRVCFPGAPQRRCGDQPGRRQLWMAEETGAFMNQAIQQGLKQVWGWAKRWTLD